MQDSAARRDVARVEGEWMKVAENAEGRLQSRTHFFFSSARLTGRSQKTDAGGKAPPRGRSRLQLRCSGTVKARTCHRVGSSVSCWCWALVTR